MGVEILDEVPDVEYIVVPVGGGGLIAGITAAVKHLKPEVNFHYLRMFLTLLRPLRAHKLVFYFTKVTIGENYRS